MSTNIKNILLSRYAVMSNIGKGSFGEVYKAVCIKNDKEIAMKIEKKLSDNPRLEAEYKIYKKIISCGMCDGIPKIYELIQTDDYNILIMEILGKNLEDIFDDNDKHFSLSTVLYIGLDILFLIQNFHNSGFIHRDIKPANFLIGYDNKEKIYITDFGLSKKYVNSYGKHIGIKFGRNIIGTARYSSLHMHLGFEPSRRDDLESIGYMLLYFLKGRLPWQGICNTKEKKDLFENIGNCKLTTSLDILCDGVPEFFKTYIEYCRRLKFDEKPDYEYLRNLFYSEIKKQNLKKHYEWC